MESAANVRMNGPAGIAVAWCSALLWHWRGIIIKKVKGGNATQHGDRPAIGGGNHSVACSHLLLASPSAWPECNPFRPWPGVALDIIGVYSLFPVDHKPVKTLSVTFLVPVGIRSFVGVGCFWMNGCLGGRSLVCSSFFSA